MNFKLKIQDDILAVMLISESMPGDRADNKNKFYLRRRKRAWISVSWANDKGENENVKDEKVKDSRRISQSGKRVER